MKALVYKNIKVLQQNYEFDNEVDFQNKLQSALKIMLLGDEDTKHFGIYFEKNYAYNYQQYMEYFLEKNYGINTNVYLESMHSIMKYFYLSGRTVKCLDIGFNAVLKYTKTKWSK